MAAADNVEAIKRAAARAATQEAFLAGRSGRAGAGLDLSGRPCAPFPSLFGLRPRQDHRAHAIGPRLARVANAER